jgi:HK97 family phage prohead protease
MSKAATITKQTKAFPFQAKDFDDEKGLVKGYLSTFDNIDDQGDRVRPGAFKRTLQNKYEYKKANDKRFLMPLLWQHDPNTPIGGYLSAVEDNIGLFVELELDLDVQKGKEAYSALKKGYVFQQSIGYDTIKSDYVKIDGKMIRDLVEIRLWEGSLVTFPANEEAIVTDVKSDKPNGRHMTRKAKEKKTVQEHYAEEMAQDLLEDWADVFLCSLTCAVLDAFKIGDQPEQDITEALDDFKELVLTKFVPEAIECDLSGYIADHSDTYSSADYAMQYGSDSKPNNSYYGYMSSNRRRSEKIGKPISSTNQQIIDAHVKSIKAFAKSAKAAMQDHANAMHDTADTVADLAGNNSKAGRAISASTAQSLNSAADAMHDHADKALSIMNEHVKAVRTAADDFANTIQGAEPAYEGDDPGKPDDGQQEGKSNPATPPQQETRSPQAHSLKSTVDEDEREFELALASLVQELKCC